MNLPIPDQRTLIRKRDRNSRLVVSGEVEPGVIAFEVDGSSIVLIIRQPEEMNSSAKPPDSATGPRT